MAWPQLPHLHSCQEGLGPPLLDCVVHVKTRAVEETRLLLCRTHRHPLGLWTTEDPGGLDNRDARRFGQQEASEAIYNQNRQGHWTTIGGRGNGQQEAAGAMDNKRRQGQWTTKGGRGNGQQKAAGAMDNKRWQGQSITINMNKNTMYWYWNNNTEVQILEEKVLPYILSKWDPEGK